MERLGKLRGVVIFGAIFAALIWTVGYAAFVIFEALQTGVLERTGRDATLALSPLRFWIGMGWIAVGGLGCAFFAWRIVVIAVRMHKKGALFVAEKQQAQRNSAPLVNDSKTATIDR
jgi:hypothetical protein